MCWGAGRDWALPPADSSEHLPIHPAAVHVSQVDLTEFEEPEEDGGSDGALWSEEEDFF